MPMSLVFLFQRSQHNNGHPLACSLMSEYDHCTCKRPSTLCRKHKRKRERCRPCYQGNIHLSSRNSALFSHLAEWRQQLSFEEEEAERREEPAPQEIYVNVFPQGMAAEIKKNKNYPQTYQCGGESFARPPPLEKKLEATIDCWEENRPLPRMLLIGCSMQSGQH